MVTLLYRFAQKKNQKLTTDTNLEDFADADTVPAYAQEAARWAVGCGILKGDDSQRLNPESPLTRAQIAALLRRYHRKVKQRRAARRARRQAARPSIFVLRYFRWIRRGGRPCPPLGCIEFAGDFCKKPDFSAGGQSRPPLRKIGRFRKNQKCSVKSEGSRKIGKVLRSRSPFGRADLAQARRFCVLQSLAYTPPMAMSSACVPASTILPSETTRMRLAARMVDRRWAMMSVVRSLASSSNACWILASVRESSALVASSRIRTGGFLRKMRAIEMRCFCPPERSVPRSPT